MLPGIVSSFVQSVPAGPVLLVPVLVFISVFLIVVAVTQRQPVAVARLARHRLAAPGTVAVPTGRAIRLPSLPRVNALGRLSALIDNERAQQQARLVLKRAGSPMSIENYFRLRRVFLVALAPALALALLLLLGQPLGLIGAAVVLIAVPRLPAFVLQRRAKQRAKEMDLLIADVLDLLVVCVEGGQSLATGLQQVANRMDNVAADEFGRLLSDINSGLSRRDAFVALADRCQSEALGIACTTIVQADKVGMSIASTLRTLSGMMRTRRRQAAETKARQAPIKMMPILVGFMLPTLLALLLGPVALEVMAVFK